MLTNTTWLENLTSAVFKPQPPGTPGFYIAIIGSIVACIVIFYALKLMPAQLRKPVIVTTTFLAGLFYAVEFFWPTVKVDGQDKNFLTFATPTMGNVLSVLTAMTLGLGIVSLLRVHGGKIVKQQSGWGNSAVLLVSMIVMMVAGLFFEKTTFFRSLFRDVLANFDAAMFAILAFYIVGAAYRAFRIKTAEASLLMLSALVVMLGQIPIGQAITNGLPQNGSFLSLLRLDNIANWLLLNVNGAAVRGINFGIGIGLMAIALRLWLSLERGAYFEAKVEEGGSEG